MTIALNKEMLLQYYSKNETIEHFALKEVARWWLYEKGCRLISTEVGMKESSCENFNTKTISDVVGIQYQGIRWNSAGMKYKNAPVYNIEAKASVSDFKNGFNISGNYNYLIIPKGTIKKQDVPSPVGLIEVDLDLAYTNIKESITIAKRAKKVELKEPWVFIEKRIQQRMMSELFYGNKFYTERQEMV